MHRVFVDSNVLGSKTQYDWMFLLKLDCRMFTLCTSEDVLDEAHRVWRRKHPEVGGEMRSKRSKLFRENFDEVLDSWVGGRAPTIKDIDDLHVHNACSHSKADILLTNNVGDFGDPAKLTYDLYTPDQFFMLISGNSPATVQSVTRKQALYWHGVNDRNSERPRISLDQALVRSNCPEFAKIVASQLKVLTGPTPEIQALRAQA
ncbi:PIN domain-containing protein (plasmid) [Coraliomargarita sp. W4R53]